MLASTQQKPRITAIEKARILARFRTSVLHFSEFFCVLFDVKNAKRKPDATTPGKKQNLNTQSIHRRINQYA
jgi:hypothetical protein